MTAPPRPTLALSGLDGLLAAVPGLLGFIPERSLVMLCLGPRPGRRVGPAIRIDLAEGTADLVDHLCRLARRHADSVVLVAYAEGFDCPPLLARLRVALSSHHVPVLDALLVAERWAVQVDRHGTVVASSWWLVPDADDAQVHAVSGELALRGRRVLAGRGDLLRYVRAPVGRAAKQGAAAVQQAADTVVGLIEGAVGDATQTLGARVDELAAWALSDLPRNADLARCAELAVLTHDVQLRDRLLARVLNDPGPEWVASLGAAVGVIPDPEAAALVCLLAAVAYCTGDGALAQVSLDRCLAAAPDYRLAHLLRSAINAGMPPADLVAAAGPGAHLDPFIEGGPASGGTGG